MKFRKQFRKQYWLLFAAISVLCSSGCGSPATGGTEENRAVSPTGQTEDDFSSFLTIIMDDPDTLDPQCTSEYYTVPLNVFDRLVEVRNDAGSGNSEIVPSLADSWEISDDGLTYTFHLHPGVQFSNGNSLTSSDVLFTFERLLTCPDSANGDVASGILGAEALQHGDTDSLEGFQVLGDLDFSITLEQPYAAFLACLSTPGASILDKETTTDAGESFGKNAGNTIGTGSFIVSEWVPGSCMVMTANGNCWAGPPRCEGLYARFVPDPEAQRILFENGELDILDLENLENEAEFFIHGDIYQDKLVQGPRVGISYIALNQSVKPLNDVRVRRALQLSLNREALLNAIYSGRGNVENGIFPHGLIGYNPSLPPIPYDPDQARTLLQEAGYGKGINLDISISSSSSASLRDLVSLVSSMWRKAGVRVRIVELSEDAFMDARKRGRLACYSSSWSADFNDPDNFIYTFFGSEENTLQRSLCFPDRELMHRVRSARAIMNEKDRLAEYQELERLIVQENASWIPLYSRQHFFIVSKRVEGFSVSWNGWSSTNYRNVSVHG